MATFDEIGNGSINAAEILKSLAINSLSTMARGLIVEMLSTNIGNFNTMNYDFMNIHMMRNAYEKSITLNVVGENAYTDGNPELTATPAQYPSYTRGNNYMEFVTNTREASKNGTLTTRVSDKNGKVKNLYLDTDQGDSQVEFTGNIVDKNSILYKTKKLIRQKKLKTIISQFHTEGVEYNGQVGSEFGESHGRNLLTKDAENGGSGYSINGYNNPYCRVWTHHYKYDKLSKTMRANTEDLNTWGGFEWEDTDKGHGKDNSKYGDGEKNYDYAWRGQHNQDRRKANSVLDTKTGLVKITPQYRNGGQNNRHTKECMFSIENLAWKDYDPYSFEKALSWEQRGPFGGRIMWFPPYGIEIQETTSARWNSNDFIGRGEPVYTYVNSERTGNLSFLMLTDHPSSIDYASWWDDNNMINGIDNGDGNSENDYLRYFAGCANDDNEGVDPEGKKAGKTGGLIIKPTPLTDEYLQENPPVIKVEKLGERYIAPEKIPLDDKNPEIVEFFVFYPNNYSGIMDAPSKPGADVNAIAYLLGGINAQKKDGVDASLPITSVFSYVGDKYIGYEMGKRNGITTQNVIEENEYIQGGKLNTKEYVPEDWKKWCYRIDHLQPYTVGDHNGTNTINQTIEKVNLKDTRSNRTNLDVSNNPKVQEMAENKASLYSFAEVAAAFYSKDMLDMPFLYDYLIDCGVNQDRVNKLVQIFTSKDRKLETVKCTGIASSHGKKNDLQKDPSPVYARGHYVIENNQTVSAVGKTSGDTYTSRNNALSLNRADTILNWLHTYSEWQNVENTAASEDNQIKQVDANDSKNVNGDSAKLYRCAHCILKFSSGVPGEEGDNRNLVGFKWVDAKPQPDGSIWNYYQRDNSVKYFEQVGKSADNYEEAGKNDITVTERQILDIFNTEGFKPFRTSTVRTNSKYRGLYNEFGVYITTFDYSKEDDPNIQEFINGMVCYKDSYIFHQRRFYKTKENYYDGIWDETYFNDITDIMATYAKGDIVLYDDDFYTCKEDFSKQHQDYTFDENDWEEVTTANINEAIRAPYRFVQYKPATGYEEKDISTFLLDNNIQVFVLCTKRNYIQPPAYDIEHWEQLLVDCYEDGRPGDVWNEGDYVTYDEGLYCCRHDGTPYTGEFNENDWDYVEYVYFSDLEDVFMEGEIVEYQDGYYKALGSIGRYEWRADLKPAMPRLICNSESEYGEYGEFDGNYCYNIGDYCSIPNSSAFGFTYYKSLIDFSEKEFAKISFSNVDWEPTKDEDLYMYEFDWELANLVVKAAGVLCWTEDKMFSTITKGAPYAAIETNDKYSCIWKYGTTNNFVTPETVNVGTNLVNYVNECELNSQDSSDENAKFRFTKDEQNYLKLLVDKSDPKIDIQILRQHIIAYRLLDSINFIEDSEGQRKVCTEEVLTEEEMKEKTTRRDESLTEGCEDSLWIDRGDGLLIQECNLNRSDAISRFDPSTGKGDWNKLRYDQEYHFYKQWIDEHPLMYEKLQEKIKYFNPAFHSMTPEGFNARLTFLQQCTRQGNTKTMSDSGGKTANNLAFGRPPYCVLRLGDFYYQMIIIENINFDYSVSDGIQWDLNTEGNGVQPMLCKVNISFKFIGGGDITGPVQRLQNAMSFNYYANASFYDNRADRVQYQPTNWATMGGAGNNEMDLDKSYAYITQLYEDQAPNIVNPVIK